MKKMVTMTELGEGGKRNFRIRNQYRRVWFHEKSKCEPRGSERDWYSYYEDEPDAYPNI